MTDTEQRPPPLEHDHTVVVAMKFTTFGTYQQTIDLATKLLPHMLSVEMHSNVVTVGYVFTEEGSLASKNGTEPLVELIKRA